uniref:Uncharacterized protein n=1 Tax=Angiostrongylus cantonensis TaxID=6313 RepID=A0A0K0DPS2_ANGCA
MHRTTDRWSRYTLQIRRASSYAISWNFANLILRWEDLITEELMEMAVESAKGRASHFPLVGEKEQLTDEQTNLSLK